MEANSFFTGIIKRDGKTIVPFQPEKITNAIWKAARSVGGEDRELARALTSQVIERLEEQKIKLPTVEMVQDLVEKVLVEDGHYQTAKSYIIYREKRSAIRNIDMAARNSLDFIKDYIQDRDWRVRENSNMSFSLQGLNNHLTSAIVKEYWLHEIYPQNIRRAHKDGDIHIHDLSELSAYCCGWDLQDFLLKGFGGVSHKIESKPPKHFQSALGQIVNFLFTLQGETAGAQAFSNFDTLLAPFVAHDNLDYDEVYQGLQNFVFNLNVPTRVGFQTPFTNITMDLTCPEYLKEHPIIIGGELKEEATYADFQQEMDMINKAFAEVMLEGDAKGRVFSFPIPTYNITADFAWDNPVYEPIWEMTAKYGIPYFSNFINSDMKPDDARSMCCRLRLDNRELRKRGGGLFGANPMTGSIGVVTINLPRLGYNSKNKDKLFRKLTGLMDLAKESLVIKRKAIEDFTEKGLYPYARYYLQNIKERFDSYWSNHFNTIGINGMNEACLNFLGKDIASPEGHQLAEEILEFMRGRLIEYQEETGEIFNLEATPAEGTSYRFAKIDRELCPGIICANDDSDTPYYTNSTHLPVGYTEDIFSALDLQDDLQAMYTGGTVFHGFLGEKMPDTISTRALVKKIAERYRLPYYTLTPSFSICPKDGYLAGEEPECPFCGKQTQIYSRIVGYITPVSQWNEGKKAEFYDRRTYAVS